jgi:Na+/H+-dicarboxylate symporter
MLEAVRHNPIYDGCATVLNVTGDMLAATLLSRGKIGKVNGEIRGGS